MRPSGIGLEVPTWVERDVHDRGDEEGECVEGVYIDFVNGEETSVALGEFDGSEEGSDLGEKKVEERRLARSGKRREGEETQQR